MRHLLSSRFVWLTRWPRETDLSSLRGQVGVDKAQRQFECLKWINASQLDAVCQSANDLNPTDTLSASLIPCRRANSDHDISHVARSTIAADKRSFNNRFKIRC